MLVAVIGIAASRWLRGAADVSLTAATQSHGSAIASVLPTRGEVVGVAHPVVVTFRAPVADRSAAERALDVKSTPAMTGKYDWLDNKVVQWVPDRYWPAHSTIALSVDGESTEFKTGPAVVGVASISQHTFTVSIDGADAGPPRHCRRRTTARTSANRACCRPRLGRPEYPTPVGSYTVLSKERTITMDSSSVGIPVDAPDGYLLTVNYAVRITTTACSCIRLRGPSIHWGWTMSATAASA